MNPKIGGVKWLFWAQMSNIPTKLFFGKPALRLLYFLLIKKVIASLIRYTDTQNNHLEVATVPINQMTSESIWFIINALSCSISWLYTEAGVLVLLKDHKKKTLICFKIRNNICSHSIIESKLFSHSHFIDWHSIFFLSLFLWKYSIKLSSIWKNWLKVTFLTKIPSSYLIFKNILLVKSNCGTQNEPKGHNNLAALRAPNSPRSRGNGNIVA